MSRTRARAWVNGSIDASTVLTSAGYGAVGLAGLRLAVPQSTVHLAGPDREKGHPVSAALALLAS